MAVVSLVASMLAGCGGPQWMDARPKSAPPETIAGVRRESGVFEGAGGVRIFTQSWRPEGEARAAVVIHHGLKSHSEHYDELARRLVGHGLAVYALDMRGHGRSAGQRAALDDFEELLADLDVVVARARADSPRVFVMGHSVGGAVVTLYTLSRKPDLAGLILLAPALRVDRPPFEAAATPLAAALSPNLAVLDVPDEQFSRSPEVVAEMGRDPFIHHPPGPARTAGALLDALARIWEHAEEMSVPLLSLHGTADRATDPRGSVEMVKRARSKDRKVLLYDGLYHDLVREPERVQVMEDIEAWLEERLPKRGGAGDE